MNFIGKAVNAGFGAFFAFIILSSLYSLMQTSSEHSIYGPFFVFLTALLAAGLCSALNTATRRLEKKNISDKQCLKIFAALAALLLISQIIFAACVDFTPRNDLKYVFTAAKNYILDGPQALHNGLPERHLNYFYVYPNNHSLFLIVLALCRIEYFVTGEITCALPIAFNIISLNLSYIFMYKCARLMYTPQKALMCAVKGLLFTPLITYTVFFYTDSIAMPWLTAAIYIYLKQRKGSEAENPYSLKKQLGLLALCAVVLAVAYKIKGSAVILIPAIIIDLIIRSVNHKNVKALIPFAAFIPVFFAISAIISSLGISVMKLSPDKLYEYRFPSVHWVMMSADNKGGYQREDFEYTKSFTGIDNKTSADIARLSEKLERQGFSGFISHLHKKLDYTWKNGTYMAGYYINCKPMDEPPLLFLFMLTHITLLFSMCRSFLTKISSKDDALSQSFILKILLIGLTVFLMLWEARCRYLVSFFALFALI